MDRAPSVVPGREEGRRACGVILREQLLISCYVWCALLRRSAGMVSRSLSLGAAGRRALHRVHRSRGHLMGITRRTKWSAGLLEAQQLPFALAEKAGPAGKIGDALIGMPGGAELAADLARGAVFEQVEQPVEANRGAPKWRKVKSTWHFHVLHLKRLAEIGMWPRPVTGPDWHPAAVK